MDLNQDILAAVKAKLPSIQAEALAEFVKESAHTKVKLAQEVEAGNRMTAELEELKKMKMSREQLLTKERVLSERKTALDQLNIEQIGKDERLKCAEDKVAFMTEMLSLIFRNTEIKRSVLRNKAVVCGGDNYVGEHPEKEEITETVE